MNKFRKNKRKIILLLMLVSLLILVACKNINKRQLKVHFLDVGQADSTLIQLPNNEVTLIDGGNIGDGKFLVDYIKTLNIKRLDYIIATHPHADHIGGLADVIESFDIGKIYMPAKTANTQVFERLLIEIKKKNLKITQAKSGMLIIDEGDLKLSIVSPRGDKYKKVNDYSIVNKLNYKNISLLFTGDAEKIAEDELIDSRVNLSADILKVGHHGSSTSSSDDFLKAINPKYAVISCGRDNKYGHPDLSLIERLKSRNIKVLRTDKMGSIILSSDGRKADFKLKD